MSTLLIMLAAVICIGYLISPLAGFSTLQILSRRIDSRYHHTSITIPPTSYCNTQRLSNYNDRELSQYWRIVQRTSTCTYAVFQDDDCEDLCDDFGEDFKPPSPKKKEVIVSNYLPPHTNTKDTSIECEDLCEDLDTDDYSAPSTTYQVASIKKHTNEEKSKSKALWWVDEEGLDTCKTCNGAGKCTCRFCGGTTFLSGVGGDTDALFVEGIGKDCPVCDEGLETCHKCAGTGYIFSWSPPEKHMNQTQPYSLHP